ncbi:D-2-hydroxyacid dehydrogenase [Pseudohaliea rubra]|uniref:D-3-phosphoglycerate dehydrogenase n=1 Tax=Pseudohaliea rubra DSM 19751 TaxID=1265313 RepID=A0A095VUN3_9GAMM|nr:D-2-hydroxyacid dehydrogenase [Pseudohaliea rubra]KGE05060.1 D-3-phosphoglycerate dehydrogenase [Pseudohaliea rubra DSM 19751]
MSSGGGEALLLLADDADALARRLAERLPPELALISCSDADSARRRGTGATLALASPALLAEVLDDLPALRWAQSTWAGVRPLVDHPRRDYTLTGVRGIFGQAMSEWVLGWLLAIERGILRRSRAAHWEGCPDGTVAGKRLGILGTGAIGCAVARRAAVLGMACRGLNRDGNPVEAFAETFALADLRRFAAGCDYLLALLPDTPASTGLVDDGLLGALPRGAVFLNGGRGSTVQTDAVVAALHAGQLRAAVLDVFPKEPLEDDDPLWAVDNLYITSHTAAPTDPGAIVELFLANLARYRKGIGLSDVVDFSRGY